MEKSDLPRPVRKAGRKKTEWDEAAIDARDMETLFAEIPNGFTVRIYRREPSWCAGLCGEMFKDADAPISVSDIQARYGGTVLQLQIVDDSGKFKGSKTLRVADVPRANYEPIDPQFARTGRMTAQPNQAPPPQQSNQGGHFGGPGAYQEPGQANPWQMIPPGLPPALARQLGAWYAGAWQPEETTKKDDSAEIMQKKMVMDMMTAQSQAQMDMMRANFENQREMMRFRQEYERNQTPKEPLSDVQHTITLLRELNGMKTEFGGDSNPTSEIIAQTAPILETAVQELIALQKMKVQSEIARIQHEQHAAPAMVSRQAPPPVTRRRPAPTLAGIPEPKGIAEGAPDPATLAAQMGAIYRNLSAEQQQAVISAFMGTAEPFENEETEENENEQLETLADSLNSDYSDYSNTNQADPPEPLPQHSETLDEEDRKVLYGESSLKNSDVSNGKHTATT